MVQTIRGSDHAAAWATSREDSDIDLLYVLYAALPLVLIIERAGAVAEHIAGLDAERFPVTS